jgi:viroplasmin and RNaseH domain-containing protein
MVWHAVFCGQKPGVYESWGVCSEYVLGLSGATYQSYLTRRQAEEVYATFPEHQNKDRKLEHVANMWCWKDWVILVQFVIIAVLWYKIM